MSPSIHWRDDEVRGERAPATCVRLRTTIKGQPVTALLDRDGRPSFVTFGSGETLSADVAYLTDLVHASVHFKRLPVAAEMRALIAELRAFDLNTITTTNTDAAEEK